MTVPPLKKIRYDQQFKEDEDETIIQEHDIISESDMENIYTDEELSADNYDDWIAFILFWVYHFSRFSFDEYILFLSSYSCTFILQNLCFYSDSFISPPPISCFALSWLMDSIDNHEKNVVFHKWLLS